MDQSVNVVQPDSEGALVTEEWTIHPSSIMPSFIEMVMVQEASRSSKEAFSTAFDVVVRWLNSLIDFPSTINDASIAQTSLSTRIGSCQQLLRQLLRQAVEMASQYKMELQLVMWYLIERASLHSSASATVSEALYGMRRSKLESLSREAAGLSPPHRKLVELSGADKTRVALLWSLLPYLKHKHHILYQKYQQQSTGANPLHGLARRICVASYLPAALALACLRIVFQWRFLDGSSVFFDPSSMALNQLVRRIAQPELASSSDPLPSSTKTGGEQKASGRPVLYLISASVAFSWLTQWRVAWVHYRRQQRQFGPTIPGDTNNSTCTSGIPPAPPLVSLQPTLNEKHVVSSGSERCPLCLRLRTIPTATTSGHVFCEACIRSYVRRFQSCPVTGIPCKETSLIKLFEPSNHAG